MKSSNYYLFKYEADEGMVFDWKEPRFTEDEEGNQIQEHLYAKVIFLSPPDTIDNYIEIVAPSQEEV